MTSTKVAHNGCLILRITLPQLKTQLGKSRKFYISSVMLPLIQKNVKFYQETPELQSEIKWHIDQSVYV